MQSMLSMTGFGAASCDLAQGRLSVQVAVVNHKGVQVQLRSELRDLSLEHRLRQVTQERLERGAATVQVRLARLPSAAWDREALSAAWKELAAMASALGAPTPRLEEVARLAPGTTDQQEDGLAAVAEQLLGEALAALARMRAQEGAALKAVLGSQLAQLRAVWAALSAEAPARVPRLREALEQRLAEASLTLDAASLAREAALIADRVDVSEELARLQSHLHQLQEALEAKGPQGRRIEFLLQEVHRELNTTGAKASDAALTTLVVQGKGVAEQMREQAANVV